MKFTGEQLMSGKLKQTLRVISSIPSDPLICRNYAHCRHCLGVHKQLTIGPVLSALSAENNAMAGATMIGTHYCLKTLLFQNWKCFQCELIL